MNTAGADEVSEILDRVRHWPSLSKITLARRILESLDVSASDRTEPESPAETPTRGVPAESVVGLLKTDREPPDDEACRRIFEEVRWKR